MTISTHAPRALGNPFVARAVSDGPALIGPWPGMSGRAALIARALTVALVTTWVALTDTRLLVVLAFAVPFWAAIELERFRTKRTRVSRNSISRIFRVSHLRLSNPF